MEPHDLKDLKQTETEFKGSSNSIRINGEQQIQSQLAMESAKVSGNGEPIAAGEHDLHSAVTLLQSGIMCNRLSA